MVGVPGRGRNGVKTAGRKGMAAEQATKGEPGSAQGAVAVDGDVGVFGAGREVSAVAKRGGGEERGEEGFVEAEEEAGGGGHVVWVRVRRGRYGEAMARGSAAEAGSLWE